MLQNAYRVGATAGIEVRVHYTWLIIFGLVKEGVQGAVG